MTTHRLYLSVALNSTGSAARSWAAPGTRWNRFADWNHYLRSAQLAHEGVFDIVFVSDHPALQRDNTSRPIHSFDPTVLFSAVAATVPDIGFLLTASTSYNSPYNLARRLATLDHISGGRVIWNVVSSFNPDIAANFGAAPLPERAERYRRAEEFLQVVKDLWLSWDTPAGPAPQGALWDETTARRIDHHGEFFDVAGPLNVPIGPQGHPVIAQAGASDAGIDLAARHADIVYASLLHKQSAFDYQARLRERALAHGRDPGDIRLLPGLTVILGATREEAYRKHEALHGRRGEDGLIADFLRRNWAVDLDARIDPDVPLDPALFAYTEDQKRPVGFVKSFAELAAAEPVTPRQLVRRVEGGHRLAVGTPREVADTILDWWSSGAVAGFNIHIPVLPDGIAEFNEKVIPLLQEAGAFPTAYDGSTIRERLKLPDPRSR
ncbi:nitrilotriacetate monooxygenase [Actinoplanes lobatus]|uniref:Nitrilotriacetate monooxygenase n=1 Tax=Actinoplanes lobatus TaxID=113568 RepID=A0A7W7HKX3_9ACTN|nr:NtaA/DmoA family FMN-dependent monooxygenase [Actinoplanes lobatus]MBB4752435.1 FMN-dependent oxidoreductase (nitrilotriacetate monooxygenase family) [Actinoplanes lobatus]GGN97691.1 nitrilotriacetate monooxygenase [Actinoplanes lobatus]GIE45787.1 nitrilotriacetate monooxygenase [Actinoplanes lobatus]